VGEEVVRASTLVCAEVLCRVRLKHTAAFVMVRRVDECEPVSVCGV
jgi:hypothetical protein